MRELKKRMRNWQVGLKIENGNDHNQNQYRKQPGAHLWQPDDFVAYAVRMGCGPQTFRGRTHENF